MAYETKYRAGYKSLDTTGYVYIKEDGYSGGVTDLTLAFDSVSLDYLFNGWEDPIIGYRASFSIINDQSDFFTLMELLTAEEQEFFITVERMSPSSFVMFEGYLDCANNEQKYLHNQAIHLVASSYLSKLQYVTPPTIEDLENDAFINIIDNCLIQTGASSDIRVNCHLYATGDTLGTTKTLFSLCGVSKEIFWKNNIDRDSALEVLKKILTVFDCYIYWYRGYWYIERYADIWNNPKNYVQYTTGESYEPADTGVAFQQTALPIDFVDLTKMHTFQSIGMIPGMREIEIKVEQQWYSNLIMNDFSNIEEVSGVPASAYYRRWTYWGGGDHYDLGLPTKGLPWKNISNAMFRVGNWGNDELYRGMYTKFKVTVDPDTSLTISFKFASIKGSFGTWSGNWTDYTFNFNYYLRHGNNYIMYNSSGDFWEEVSTNEEGGYNTKVVEGTEFDDGNVSVEVTITIPLGEVEGLTDSSGGTSDEELTFGLLCEKVDRELTDGPCTNCWYGDVVITASGELTNNNFKGTINTNFLNKMVIDFPFSDVENLNLKNGIYRTAGLDERTETWEDGVESLSVIHHKIRDKFRLYNISRQKLVAKINISYAQPYRPFERFEDSNQAGKYFLLAGYTYKAERDELEILLMEYDNQEEITIA